MTKKQNKIIASFSSGRGNTLDIILPNTEIKGTGPRFVSVSFAQRVAESLNTIFKNKFKITYDTFCVEELVIPKPISLNPDVNKVNPFNWGKESFEDAITNGDYFFSLNDKFNWGQDDVTKAIYEFHTEKSALRTIVINTKSKETIKSGGGYTFDTKTICLYDFFYLKREKPYFKDDIFMGERGNSKFTLGGTYIHELMYHIYPDDFGKGQASTNYLRTYFLLEENSNGFEEVHYKGKYQRDKQFWKEVRERNMKTIWKSN